MDLVYTNHNRVDVGVLHDYAVNIETTTEAERNTFEIKHPLRDNVISIGDYWYIDGTEYGGKVDSVKVDTATKLVVYAGRNWRGFLSSKIIEPPAGQDYYTVSGDLNRIISSVINKIELSDLFVAETRTVKSVGTYKFDRYTDALTGLTKLLSNNGCKLMFRWASGKVHVWAEAVVDWSNVAEFTSDHYDFTIKKDTSNPNHLIALGGGELKDRLVIHRYLNSEGKISSTKYYTGLDEIVAVYDYNGENDPTELQMKADDYFDNFTADNSLEVDVKDIEADIGDIFTATSFEIGLTVSQFVQSKITDITEDTTNVQYYVGASIFRRV